ncbi:MAG: hypothetical protein ABH983_01270 [Candidatus Micrarchaeota archaeon]
MDLDQKISEVPEYTELLSKMFDEDKKRLEFTKKMAEEMKTLTRRVYSSMKWPTKLIHPMFEARTAYAVPNNYFQNIQVDGEKLGNSFAHGAMRSLFFVGKRLVLFSKGVYFKDGKEFFTHSCFCILKKENTSTSRVLERST